MVQSPPEESHNRSDNEEISRLFMETEDSWARWI